MRRKRRKRRKLSRRRPISGFERHRQSFIRSARLGARIALGSIARTCKRSKPRRRSRCQGTREDVRELFEFNSFCVALESWRDALFTSQQQQKQNAAAVLSSSSAMSPSDAALGPNALSTAASLLAKPSDAPGKAFKKNAEAGRPRDALAEPCARSLALPWRSS